ncbi:MAG: methylenetetrahydrofolate reductase [NAD(P)H] [SAR86 cluster bacterium]|uniref:Methylenetetrahydrofolate reductase n=1 Tax=SAR86 cluster bacterium TaxID=2030880 RepID=A0A2A5CHH7_9GAMM|nr:MAG: methylenetetrahydrofolate reductase [NAD(P)H] [SAR86 cluster bacterium]
MSFSDKNEEVSVSFEFFPPADLNNAGRFWDSIDDLASLNPSFISITYGAGGTTRDRSLKILQRILAETSLDPIAHLTCVGSSKDEADDMARQFHAAGITRLVALRGDPPGGQDDFSAHPQGYANATEFIQGLSKVADFDITVAAYPEKHPESPSLEHEIDVLKQKIDAGAKRCITQFFFDTDVYLRFVDKARSSGIDIPIIPGILPILNFSRVQDLAARCGAHIPAWLIDLFEGIETSSSTNNMLAAAVVIEQCDKLYAAGVRDFHFYTLNKSDLARAVCHSLGVRAEGEST